MVVIKQEDFVNKLLNKWSISREDFELLTPYLGWDKKIEVRCNKCGKVMTTSAGSFCHSKRKWFCQCYGQSPEWWSVKEQFDDWLKSNKNFEVMEDFKGRTVNLSVKCLRCGATQKRSVQSLIQNDGCLVCENKHAIKKTQNQFKRELEEIYGDEYLPLDEYKDANSYILMRHTPCGKIYRTKPHNLLTQKGGTCPVCSTHSNGERAIARFLDVNQIEYEKQKRLSSYKRAPFDFYIPSKNLLIEFQGIQHFQPVARFGGQESFVRQCQVDIAKQEIAEAEGYELLYINYNQIKDINQILAQRLSPKGEQLSKSETATIPRDEDIV